MKKILVIMSIILSLLLMFNCSKKKEDIKIEKPAEIPQQTTPNMESKPTVNHPQSVPKIKEKIVQKQDVPTKGGCLYAAIDNGQKLILPLKKTDVDIDVTAGIVQANVKQTFTNDTNSTLEALYVFPLPVNATITEMEMRVGDRIIKSEVQEKQAAKKAYYRAKKQGRKAALLEQKRDNIFKTSVANFHPGETVIISFSYIKKMQYKVGEYEVNFPMVVGQRYIPYKLVPDENNNAKKITDVEDAADLNPPLLPKNAPNEHLLSINIDISGLPIDKITSSTHSIKVNKFSNEEHNVILRENAVVPDSDFNIKLKMKKDSSPQITNVTSKKGDYLYGMTTVFPPTKKLKQKSQPRDVVFLIDTSGSMNGASIGQAKQGLKECMNMLKSEDRFTIVRFSDNYSSFSPELKEANPNMINAAVGYISALQSGGGTEMQKALDYVLDLPIRDEAIPMVVFLTDGCVGNENTLFKLLNKKLGRGRLFTFGIGSAPNEHLMRKMAEIGRGQSRFIRSHEDISTVMSDFFATLDNPVLTDISVDWKKKGSRKYITFDHFPAKCSDVFYERPLQIFAKYPNDFCGTMRIRGKLNSKNVNYEFPVNKGESYPAIEKIYAREQINEIMYDILKTGNEAFLKKDIIRIALDHQLVSKYTSRVAEEYELQTKQLPNGKLKTVKVPANLPKGWQRNAFEPTATNNTLFILIGGMLLGMAVLIKFIWK